MAKIHYESDFKIRETFQMEGSLVGFTFTYYVRDNSYTASWDGTTYTNCKSNEDGSVTVLFTNHGLGVGKLRAKREFAIQDSDFPDHAYNAIVDDDMGITLTSGTTDFFDFGIISTIEMPKDEALEIVNNTIIIKQGNVDTTTKILSLEKGKVEQGKLYL